VHNSAREQTALARVPECTEPISFGLLRTRLHDLSHGHCDLPAAAIPERRGFSFLATRGASVPRKEASDAAS
jgi:hypothetical protein